MKLKDRLNACWHILSNKEFYCGVIKERYKNGEPAVIQVFTNLPTKTAINKLIHSLKLHLKFISR